MSTHQPAVPAESDPWHNMPYSQLDYQGLEDYTVVKEVPSLTSLSIVEAAICRHLRPKPEGLPDDFMFPYERVIHFNPIGELIPPRRFYGRLLDGSVTLLPFSVDLVAEQQPKAAAAIARGEIRPNQLGFTVVYQGELRATNAALGWFALFSTYSLKSRSGKRSPSPSTHNLVRRTVGAVVYERPDAEDLLAFGRLQSARRAQWLIKKGVQHPLQGGTQESRQPRN